MKTNLVSIIGKGLCIGALSAFLISCGDKQPSNPAGPVVDNGPAWINSNKEAKKVAESIAVGVASAKILDGDINYALNQASMQARVQIAQMVGTKVEQAIIEMSQADGKKVDGNTLQAARQKVEATLKQTEIVEKWVDKSQNPQILWVLVGMDKEAFETALKGGSQVLNIDANKAFQLKTTVEGMLRD